MKLVLHKIVMPFSVADYEKGFIYVLTYLAKQATGKGSGVEVKELKDDGEYKLPDGSVPEKCIYTDKVYHCERFVSNWVRKIAIKWFGENSLKFIEHAWNCYPYLYTETRNMQHPEKVEMNFESVHLENDKGETEEPKYIWDSKLLKKPQSFKGVNVRVLDITEKMKKLKANDPTQVRSEKANIGPLPASTKKKPWHKDFEGPHMCAYKLTRSKFNITFGGTMESKFIKQQEFALKRFHKLMYCLMDKWWDMTLEEILEWEKEVNKELEVNLKRDDINVEGAADFDGEGGGPEEQSVGDKSNPTSEDLRAAAAAEPTTTDEDSKKDSKDKDSKEKDSEKKEAEKKEEKDEKNEEKEKKTENKAAKEKTKGK